MLPQNLTDAECCVLLSRALTTWVRSLNEEGLRELQAHLRDPRFREQFIDVLLELFLSMRPAPDYFLN